MKRLLIGLVTVACLSHLPQNGVSAANYEAEIRKAEKDFNDYAQSHSISEAFYAFADADAVIKRENDTLIKGRENIRAYYRRLDGAKVTWSPDFVSVSTDGTLGYTFGKYDWQAKAKDGRVQSFKGVFHTVWKRQKDGSWKYVWD